MFTKIAVSLVSISLVAALAAPANAQYIARKLERASYLINATGISGNRVVGGFDAQYGVRNRYDGVVWDVNTGAASYGSDGATMYKDISGDFALRDGGAFSIYGSYNPLLAQSLADGTAYSLSYSAGSYYGGGYSNGNAGIRGDWAWGNQQNHVFGSYAYYDVYGSRVVNLKTGETKDYSWYNYPFSYSNRQFVDVSNGKILQNYYGTYSLRDIDTDVETSLTTGLSSISGMSGTKIAGDTASGAGLYDYATNMTTTLSKAGLTSTTMKQIGVGQSVGNGTNSATNQQNALRWDNTTGAVTNLHDLIKSAGYTSSSVINVDKQYEGGGILLSADRASGTDYIALRQFTGTVVGVGEGEIATFIDDYTQTGGVIINEGTIQWTNPPHWWNLQNGLLTGSGYFYGNINNNGGTLSGGGAGGGTGGGTGGGGGFGGDGGGGSGIGAFTSTGGYMQSGAGTLLVSIGGATAFDTFTFGGTATLGGILEISLLNGYVPNYRQEFAFFSAPNTVGTWESIYSPGHDWEVRYESNGATLIYNGIGPVAVPESGTAGLLASGGLVTLIGLIRRSRRTK